MAFEIFRHDATYGNSDAPDDRTQYEMGQNKMLMLGGSCQPSCIVSK